MNRMVFGAVLGLILGVPAAARAEQDCGCKQQTCSPCKTCCKLSLFCRHHCCCCDDHDRGGGRFAPQQIPRAALVDSMPVFSLQPGVMTIPVMNFAGVAGAGRAAPTPARDDCGGSADRLTDLERRVDALDTRTRSILRAVELNTVALERLAAGGKLPQPATPAPGNEQ